LAVSEGDVIVTTSGTNVRNAELELSAVATIVVSAPSAVGNFEVTGEGCKIKGISAVTVVGELVGGTPSVNVATQIEILCVDRHNSAQHGY
jgi:hypothetical protein